MKNVLIELPPVGLETQDPYTQVVKSKKNQVAEDPTAETLFALVIDAVQQVHSPDEAVFLKSVIDNTKAIVRDRGDNVPSLVPFLTVLIKKCSKGELDDLIRYSNLLNKLETNNDHSLTLWLKIFNVLSDSKESPSLKKLLDVQVGLETHSTLLNSIAELFDYPPYLDIEQFIIELRKNKKELKAYIDSFDTDPKATRAPVFNTQGALIKSKQQILNEQFDTTEVRQVVTKIQSLVDGLDLPRKQQYALAQQMIYINAIGNDHPFAVEGRVQTNLTNMSRAGLRNLSDTLIAQVRNPILGEHNRLKAQLNLLAVMREQYFRITGKFIYSNQILVVLMSLTNPRHNILMELDNEEEKNIATALLAAMQWVIADGGSVDVCTTNRGKLVQQYSDQGIKNFFAYLGIPSAAILANDPVGTYLVGGINYSTLTDLAPYGDRAQVENEDLSANKLGQQLSRNLIINGSDFSTFDDRAHLDVSLDAGDKESESNHYSWIYPLINIYKELGRIVGIFDLIGTKHDLVKQNGKLNIDSAYQVPSHKTSPNTKSDTLVAADNVEGDKNKSIEDLAKIQRQKKQALAVERYYLQTVSIIQQTVLTQFDEWQAFLHLVHPQSVWKKIDSELLVERDALITLLGAQWTKCLDDSDPERGYQNPFIRRDRHNKLQTAALDQAIKEYERAVNVLWTTKRSVLKAKTEGAIKDGSVNALRCTYLEGLVFNDQLQLNRLAIRNNRQALIKEKHNTNRYLDSGLDINGAMLAYSDVPKKQYKLAFAKSQHKLLVKDLLEEIERSSLSDTARSLFLERVNNTQSFQEFELVLIDYNKWLDPQQYTEKYRVQPIINELIRVYNYLGLQESDEVQVLKYIYLDNVALEIVEHLESSLSWASEKNRGFEYWIERTAVKNAANGMLHAVDEIRLAKDTPSRQRAIKHLYKVLTVHQAQLEELWIFSFGHENTRDLINKTLKTLDDLTAIGSGRDQLDATFIKECKEEAHADLMKEHFNAALQRIEDKYGLELKNNPQWNSIKEQLNTIQSGNNTVYAIDELYYFLSKSSKELNRPNSPLFQPVIALRGEVRTIWNKFYQKHKDLISQSGHFETKAESLQQELKGLPGYKVKSVTLKPVHTGFGDSFDLIIEGRGSNPLFDNFAQYNSEILFLDKERATLIALQEQCKDQIVMVHKLQKEQIPLLKDSGIKPIDLELFPKSYRGRVNEIVALKELVVGKLPDDLSAFSQQEQMCFLDRDLVKTFDLTHFTLEQINQVKDKQLKADFIDLYNKINGNTQAGSKSLFSKVIGFVTPSLQQESSEDLLYQFAELQGRPSFYLNGIFQMQITKKVDALVSDLATLETEAVTEIKLLTEKIEFIDEKRTEELNTSGIFIKRFENLDEFYDFENDLRKLKPVQPQPVVQRVTSTASKSVDIRAENAEDTAIRMG